MKPIVCYKLIQQPLVLAVTLSVSMNALIRDIGRESVRVWLLLDSMGDWRIVKPCERSAPLIFTRV